MTGAPRLARRSIGHGLHGSAVGEHRHVALEEAAELGVEVDGPRRPVVTNRAANPAPQREGGVRVVGDHAEEGATRL